MTYRETLDYLYHTLPMFSHQGSAAFKKDLTNIRALCAILNYPEKSFRAIHVGGTNGKGSVSHMLAAALQTAGYKTGLYTSPHLYDFRERIKINGIEINEDFVVDFVARLQSDIKKIEPSFFEITVAMAFQYFACAGVDVAVIEVGLGGRLDSTNIINPILSIITNISWDHTNLLGHTLPLIAAEKAGIIKQETPVVIGEHQPETDTLFMETAAAVQAPIYFAEDFFSVTETSLQTDRLLLTVKEKAHGLLKKFTLDLPGIYQTKNAVTVLTAAQVLNEIGFGISDEQLQTALATTQKKTGLQGRWAVLRRQPDVVLDVAHNEAGIAQLAAHLAQLSYRRLHLVFGVVRDKDLHGVLKNLPPQATYYFTQARIPRALPAAALQQAAADAGLRGATYDDVKTALTAALHNAEEKDLIVVCGSIFLVAEVDKTFFNT